MFRKWHALTLIAALAPMPAYAGFDLGIKAKNVPPFPGAGGVQVVTVDVPGPALNVGLSPGDLITNIDAETGAGWQRVNSFAELNAFMQQSQGKVRLFWVHGTGVNQGEVQLRVTDPGVVNLRRRK